MFAAPNIRDVEAQQATQQQQSGYGMQSDPKLIMTTTTTSYGNPAQNGQQQPPQPGVLADPALQQQQMQQQGSTTGAMAAPPKGTIIRTAHAFEWGSVMLLVAFFSLVLMIAASQICGTNPKLSNCLGLQAYQVAVAVISLVISFFFGILHLIGKFESVAYRTWVSLFLFLWWIAGVIVLTYIGDFTLTTRAAGYFSTWFCFGFSALSLIAVSESFEYGLDKTIRNIRKPLFFLCLASLVAMGASIGPCSPRQYCNSYNAYAVVLSVVSLFVALILFFWPASLERSIMKLVAWLFVIWWVFGAAVTTLGGPFFVAGNGFFAVYAALISSIALVAALQKETPPAGTH